MSGAVGSMPSFTRSGRPSRRASASFSASAPSGGVHGVRELTRRGRCRRRRARRHGVLWAATRQAVPPPRALMLRLCASPLMSWSTSAPAGDRAGRAPEDGCACCDPLRRAAARHRVVRVRHVRSVASDLPSLTRFAQLKDAKSSVLLDDLGHPIGVLSQQNRVIVTPGQIPPIVKEAVISIEDKRFETNAGSTSAASRARSPRTSCTKAPSRAPRRSSSSSSRTRCRPSRTARSSRSSGRRRSPSSSRTSGRRKRSSPRTSTRSTSATAPTGSSRRRRPTSAQDVNHLGCGKPGPQAVRAAARAVGGGAARRGSSSRRRPTTRRTTRSRRASGATWSCARCSSRATSPGPSTKKASARRCLRRRTSRRRRADRRRRRRRLLHELGPAAGGRTLRRSARFDGGLRIKTTLDLELQRAAEQAVNAYLAGPDGPTASLVAIENSTGEVRAMVGGRNYDEDAVQPRDRGRAPAGLVVQGVRSRGGARGRHLAGIGLDLEAEDLRRARHAGGKSSSCTTTKATTRARTR